MDRQHGVVLGDRLGEPFQRRQCVAAIDARAGMARREHRHAVEGGKRVRRPVEFQQHVAAIVERLEIIRLQNERAIDGRERLLVALERGERHAEVSQRLRRLRIDLERGFDEGVGSSRLAALELDEAGKMQRVEMIGACLEHARADFFRLGEPPLPKMRYGLLDRLRDVGLARSQIRLRHGWRVGQRALSSPRAKARRAASRCSGRMYPATMRSAVTSTAASSP